MKKAVIAGGGMLAALVLGTVYLGQRALEKNVDQTEARSAAISPPVAPAAAETPPGETQGFLYGRITTPDGATYEGRLRWGAGDQEAFWGDYVNGSKKENPWVAHAPPDQFKERREISILGLKIADHEHRNEVGRLFMARFGDIARIESQGRDVKVTLKSGTVFDLNRFDASDYDDGVRVWDAKRGAVDLDSLRIRSIELLPTPPLTAAPQRLHGTVRTRRGDFTGFMQWDREECVGTDELDGHTDDGELSLRFETIRSIERRSRHSSLVTLLDGREITLSGTNDVGDGNRGLYVDDPRYGRVLVSWDAFARVDFSPAGSGPAYGDFPPATRLTGSVTTRAGDRLTGRLIYDLDESETVETLDAPTDDVDYTIPFGLIASIAPPAGEGRARVTLHNGEELQLERNGDLGDHNAGMLVFADGSEKPRYVPWSDIAKVEFDRPPAMYPSLAGR